ncbi:MAG: hypothetical protein R2748_13615 [Bryobacterales bacterium]
MKVGLLFLCLAAPVLAADLTGTWIGAMVTTDQRRPPQDIAFQFDQDGAALAGKQYGDELSSPIQDGSVSDKEIRFNVVIREQAGNQINDVLYRFEGSSEGDALLLTREKASAQDSVSGAPVPVRRPDDNDEQDRARRFHTFRLEKLF